MFSYLSPETRVRKDHALRAIRSMVDEVLRRVALDKSEGSVKGIVLLGGA